MAANLPILFRTLEGGIVTISGAHDYTFVADCDPCGASETGHIENVRPWANTHAGQCRAIPRPAIPA